MLSFSDEKEMKSLIVSADAGNPNDVSFHQFEVACDDLIADLELLAKQPRKRKRDYINQTKFSKACRLIPISVGSRVLTMSKSCAILEDQSLSLQAVSNSAVEMPKIVINLFDFVSDLQSRKNWKESYLTGRFRVDEVTGEIKPVIKTRCKDQSCISERQSLQREKAIFKKNLANHEKCITGLSRQHTQILKVFNKKDKEIERLERQLKGIFKINES
jgi:hypothetical protein